jgi:hypothetical protein
MARFWSISIKAAAVGWVFQTAVFLILGFVSAQLQGLLNLRLRQSLAQYQKSSLPAATSFLSMLLLAVNSQAAARNSSKKMRFPGGWQTLSVMESSLLFCAASGYFAGMSRMLMAAMFLLLTLARAPAASLLYAADFSRGITNGWQNVAFFKTPTDYQTRCDGTNFYLRAVADKSCSALSVKLDVAPPPKLRLRWRWRIAGVNTNGSERDLKKFDHAARVFVAFDTLIGPPRTLNYLWANVERPGTVLEHPKSGRAQLFVLESGNGRAGEWVAEERDVTADWQRVFPGKPMPRVDGLGVMTDGDSLGVKLTGDYADIELSGE